MSRSAFLTTAVAAFALLLAPAALCAQGHTKGRAVAPFTLALHPGDYVWHPEVSPTGPVIVLVSLPLQILYVYRNGIRIGRSTVSTGKPGKRTPTGVFTVLQKKVDHTSTIYKGAKMPHMQRLTWSGIALHAGHLPGYPASAGCVRMPVDFAAKLYAVTGNGTTVIIADQRFAPRHALSPGLLFSGKTGENIKLPPPGSFTWTPDRAPKGPLSLVLSGGTRTAYVYRDGVEIGRAMFTGDSIHRISGTHAYSALAEFDSHGRREWLSIASVGGRSPNLKNLFSRLSFQPAFLDNVRPLVSPGTTVILTNAPVDSQTHSSPGFDILDTASGTRT